MKLLITLALVYASTDLTRYADSVACNQMVATGDSVYVKCTGNSVVQVRKIALNNTIPSGVSTLTTTIQKTGLDVQVGCIDQVNGKIVVGGVLSGSAGNASAFTTSLNGSITSTFDYTVALQPNKEQVAYNCHFTSATLPSQITYTGAFSSVNAWVLKAGQPEIFSNTQSEILDSIMVNGVLYAVTSTTLLQVVGNSIQTLYTVPSSTTLTSITYDPLTQYLYLGGTFIGYFSISPRVYSKYQNPILIEMSTSGQLSFPYAYNLITLSSQGYSSFTALTLSNGVIYAAGLTSSTSTTAYYVKFSLTSFYFDSSYCAQVTEFDTSLLIQKLVVLPGKYVVVSGTKRSNGYIEVFSQYGSSVTTVSSGASSSSIGIIFLILFVSLLGCCACIGICCWVFKITQEAQGIHGTSWSVKPATQVVQLNQQVTPVLPPAQNYLVQPAYQQPQQQQESPMGYPQGQSPQGYQPQNIPMQPYSAYPPQNGQYPPQQQVPVQQYGVYPPNQQTYASAPDDLPAYKA